MPSEAARVNDADVGARIALCRLLQQREEFPGQEGVAELVRRHVDLVAVGRQASGLGHDPRVCDEHVKAGALREDAVCRGANRGEGGEVALYEGDGIFGERVRSGSGCFVGALDGLFGGRDIATGEEDAGRVVLGELDDQLGTDPSCSCDWLVLAKFGIALAASRMVSNLQ